MKEWRFSEKFWLEFLFILFVEIFPHFPLTFVWGKVCRIDSGRLWLCKVRIDFEKG